MVAAYNVVIHNDHLHLLIVITDSYNISDNLDSMILTVYFNHAVAISYVKMTVKKPCSLIQQCMSSYIAITKLLK